MYWCETLGILRIQIPKKHQPGYLKTPVGHHDNELSQFVKDSLHTDCDGLEGYLVIKGHQIEDGEAIRLLAEYLNAEPVQVQDLSDFMDNVINEAGK